MALQLNVGSLTSGTGIDVQGTVDQLMSLQKAPLTQLQRQQAVLQTQSSALTDIQERLQSLQSAIRSLGDFTGSLTARTTTSSQASAVTATANSSAAISQHQISIDHLALASSWYSKPFSSTSTFSAGSFTVQLGSKQPLVINVAQGDTLQTVADKINKQNGGVTANVITDANGSRLTLISNSTGVANEITLASDSVGFGFAQSTKAQDALLTVDGVQIDSATNTISTVISGVTLNLTGSTTGTAIVTVQVDGAKASQAISDFVDAYNSAIQAINGQFTYNAAAKTSGPLAGDGSLRSIQQTLLNALTFSISGNSGISSLMSLGMTMQDDGTLTLDNTKLDSALASNSSAVQNFFQSTSPKGFSAVLSTMLSSTLDPITGSVTVDLKGISNTNSDLQNQIDDMNDRLNSEEQALLAQFEQVDALLRSYPTTMNQIDAILGTLPSSGKSSSR